MSSIWLCASELVNERVVCKLILYVGEYLRKNDKCMSGCESLINGIIKTGVSRWVIKCDSLLKVWDSN